MGSIPTQRIPDRLAVGLLILAQATVVRFHVWELRSLKTEEDDDVGVREGARIFQGREVASQTAVNRSCASTSQVRFLPLELYVGG